MRGRKKTPHTHTYSAKLTNTISSTAKRTEINLNIPGKSHQYSNRYTKQDSPHHS
jgi:hypothetical protein